MIVFIDYFKCSECLYRQTYRFGVKLTRLCGGTTRINGGIQLPLVSDPLMAFST